MVSVIAPGAGRRARRAARRGRVCSWRRSRWARSAGAALLPRLRVGLLELVVAGMLAQGAGLVAAGARAGPGAGAGGGGRGRCGERAHRGDDVHRALALVAAAPARAGVHQRRRPAHRPLRARGRAGGAGDQRRPAYGDGASPPRRWRSRSAGQPARDLDDLRACRPVSSGSAAGSPHRPGAGGRRRSTTAVEVLLPGTVRSIRDDAHKLRDADRQRARGPAGTPRADPVVIDAVEEPAARRPRKRGVGARADVWDVAPAVGPRSR